MPTYAVTYRHPDEAGWQAHVMAHVRYLQELLREGALLASGPCKGTEVKAALLILTAPDRAALDTVIARDPFAEHGLIADMTVTEWDPLFGAFNAASSMPGQLQGEDTAYLLRSPKNAERLLESVAEFEAGRGIERKLV